MRAQRMAALVLACIVGMAVLVYAGGLSFYFVADDFRYLELAGQMRGPADILPHLQGSCTRVGWPAVVLVFWLAGIIGGLQPVFYRLFPLAIHAINVLLVFVLVRRVTSARENAAALVAALVFALHPRQHEAIMWLAALTWPAGTMFTLLAAICYVTWRQTSRLPWIAAAVLSVILAMISNPTVVVPLILVAYDVLQRRWAPGMVVVWSGLAVIVGLLGLLCGFGSLPGGDQRASYGLGLSGVTHLAVFISYILLPVPLNLKDMLETTPLIGYTVVALTVGLICLAALGVLRQTLLARWGVIWSVLAIVPPALFSAYVSDRYMSVMLVGVALTCAGVVQGMSGRRLRLAALVACLWGAFVLPQIMVKVEDWRQASRLTASVRDETLARYPQVADGTRFYYVDLPDMVNRSLVWSYGIDSAVRVWYNNPTLRAHKSVEFGVPVAPADGDLILDYSGRW